MGNQLKGIYAFGSRVRGDHTAWSDFDVLVIVEGKNLSIELEIISMFVEAEKDSGISFSPVIKDWLAFRDESQLCSPFFQNLMKEQVAS